MFTKGINFKNFSQKKKNSKVNRLLIKILRENNEVIKSLKTNYKNSFTKKKISDLKKFIYQ